MRVNSKWQKITATLLAAVMGVALIPNVSGNDTVLAADLKSKDNTCLGVSGIASPVNPSTVDPTNDPTGSNQAWSGSYVYYGYYQGDSRWVPAGQIKFRVLAKDSKAYTSKESLFLDSDIRLFNRVFDNEEPYTNSWSDSTLREMLNTSFLAGFTDVEKNAIAVSKGNGGLSSSSDSYESYKYDGSVSVDDKVFLLDSSEVVNGNYGYSSDSGWTYSSGAWGKVPHSVPNHVKQGYPGDCWWLRSKYKGENGYGYAGAVLIGGALSNGTVDYHSYGVAPAMNIDQESILFSTALTGNIGDVGTEYKLTLIDEDMVIAVTDGESVKADGNTITVPYTASGSNGGNANCASVVILDKEYTAGNKNGANILYYGEIGILYYANKNYTGTFTLPSSLSLGGWDSSYYVYLISEKNYDGKTTDYASVPVKLSAPGKSTPTPTPTTKPVATATPTPTTAAKPTDKPTATPTPKSAYVDMPNVVGMGYEDAKTVIYDTLKGAGFLKVDISFTYYDKSDPITSQEPKAGTKLTVSDSIVVTIKADKNTDNPKSTWKQDGKNWYYYDANGSKVKGWQEINKVWYLFDSNGVMQTGWVESGGKWYYLKDTGAMYTGWIGSGGKWYYLGSSGAMATGWIEDGGKWYFLGSSGAMATGWIKQGGKWYFLSASGAMATGWVQSGGKWYYMSPSGAMVEEGWVQYGATWYYFDSNGVMVTGDYVIKGKTNRFSSSGAWIGYA